MGVGCTLTLFVAVRGGLLLDKAMIFIMLSYSISFATDVPILDQRWWNVMRPLSTGITIGLIYFFIFEMMRLRDKLESESFEEHVKRHRALRVVKWVVYSIWVVAQLTIGIIFRYFENMQPEIIAENHSLFDGIIIARTATRLGLEAFMVYNFVRVFNYLLDKKKKLRGSSNNGLIAVYITRVEVCIFVSKTLIQNIISMLFDVSVFPYNRSNSPILRFLYLPLHDILDMMLYLGILFMFYQQTRGARGTK